jgi:hypothetical protein
MRGQEGPQDLHGPGPVPALTNVPESVDEITAYLVFSLNYFQISDTLIFTDRPMMPE